jgi:hypothetical protein
MARLRTLPSLLALLAFAVSGTASAESESETPLDQAREESGVKRRPASRYELPAGELRVSSELLAASRTPVRFRLDLDRRVPGAKLVLRLPRLWLRRGVSGLPFARVPGGDRTAVLTGSNPKLEIENVGIPAGTYRAPFEYRRGRRTLETGVARVVLYAPVREERAPTVFSGRSLININATNDVFEESEAFIAARPGLSDRVILGINSNDVDPCCSAWISGDRGQTWVKRTLPAATDKPASANPEVQEICGDPMLAADDLGNLWYGNLTCDSVAPSRIVVNRVAAGGNTFQAQNVGLKFNVAGQQDKNLMAIDNSPTSPNYGRLYVVWGEPSAGGGVNVVIVQCDTRPGGVPNAANCDDADNWSAPATVAVDGSFIYADVAVGPDGRVYVTWWDYSANNAIRGDSCDPGTQNCSTTAAWTAGGTHTVATLDPTGGSPIPFACPIVAQPGGRAAPAPQVEASRAAADPGRVYVTWSDLRAGSGTTRCDDDGVSPLASNLTWDSFVASAAATLPGTASPSTSVGTRLLTDGEAGGEPNSDDWFPWLAVDQSTGQAYADFYSTREDSIRQTTNFYVRAVTPTGGGNHTLGNVMGVSAGASDYSANPCCDFGNDYGDYEGIDAVEGAVFPVWTDNHLGDGEAYTIVPTLSLSPLSLTATETAGDGDGAIEPGESAAVLISLWNVSTVGGTNIGGTLTAGAGATVTQPNSFYPDIPASVSANNAPAYGVDVSSGAPCNQNVTLFLALTALQQDTPEAGIKNFNVSAGLPVICAPTQEVTGLVATPQVQAVGLDWNDTPAATSYKIFRRNSDGSYPTTPTATSTTSAFVDAGRTPGLQECYKVQATNAAGDGPQMTGEACATPLEPTSPPGAIVGLTATADAGSVRLDWLDTPLATVYNVFRGGTQIASLTASAHTDSGLPSGIQQCYRVHARNAVGDGPLSNEVCATPPGGDGAPNVKLGGKKRQRIGRTRAVTVTATCTNEACGLTATGGVNVSGAARSFRLKGVTKSAAPGATVRLRLRLRRKAVRGVRLALRARRRVRAKVTVTAVDGSGNSRTARITVRARR